MQGEVWRRQPLEHARDLERTICVDLAPNRAVSLGDFPAQGVVARRASRFFNHLRMLEATSR
jgi:hypothetical protein